MKADLSNNFTNDDVNQFTNLVANRAEFVMPLAMATGVLSRTAFLWYWLYHCWLSSVWGLHTSTEAPIAELPGESNRYLFVSFHSLRFRLTSNLQIGAFLILLGDVFWLAREDNAQYLFIFSFYIVLSSKL